MYYFLVNKYHNFSALILEEKFFDKGVLYKPTSKLHEKLISKTPTKPLEVIKKESEAAERLKKSNQNAQEKKRSNLELFKEELKR